MFQPRLGNCPLWRRALIGLLCLDLVLAPIHALAGDLNTEVNRMFDSLGAIGNYTAPGAFKGQVYNTYTGGSLFLRSPTKTYQLASLQFPHARGGCGGIDLFSGSFSHISGQEFKNMLRNISAALPGIAFQVALDVLSPLLGGITKWVQPYLDMINNARINSCETAVSLVSSAAESVGFDEDAACGKVAVWMGDATDADDGKKQCQSNRTGILTKARTSSDPNINTLPPLTGNLVWQALKGIDTIDDQEREFIMSMVGTVIYPRDGENRQAQTLVPTLTSMTKLLYGDSANADGTVSLTLLRCDEFTDCNNPTERPYVHTPFLTRVTTLMRQISQHIQDRTPIPNNSEVVAFVSTTSEPVYRMMSIGNTNATIGLADTLIDRYAGVVAADYAYVFLDRYFRLGMVALMKNYKLSKQQKDDIGTLAAHARTMLSALGQEKATLYTRVASYNSVATHLEALERQLRSSMPQHVIDMLGFQSALVTH